MPSQLCHPVRFILALLIAGAAWAAPAGVRTLTIKPASGSGPAVQIAIDGGRIRVTAGNEVILTGDTKDGQKRRYLGKNGALVAEVKLGEPDGFKVRNPGGKLLWKIKTTEGKTKVSDNEENKGAFEMAVKGTTVRVAKDDRLLGSFAAGPAIEAGGANATKVKDPNGNAVFLVEPATRSLAGGVLLMAAIPAELRYLIMAELSVRVF